MNIDAVESGLPLSTLLSQVLVAFTIEFDNEFERQMPHRTTHGSKMPSRAGPWLVSLVMWSNCMQFIDEHGLSVSELERLARTRTNFNGMERWGYIVVEQGPRSSRLIRATPKGRQAQEVWRPLFPVIEQRWRARFGEDQIDHLRKSLAALISRIDTELPDCLPILHYGLFSTKRDDKHRRKAEREDSNDPQLPLSALLSRALLAFAIEFECESDLSLAISANVLRVLDERGVRVQDLPLLTGVSKEAVQMAMGVLEKKSIVVVEPNGSRAKVARLTNNGKDAQAAYHHLLGIIEQRWRERFGEDNIRALREPLERLVEPGAPVSPLFRGLEPHPGGWRASVRKPMTLPHYPMVLHRGGYPDGS
jgi:DNA-binding MarR family transcriptional regulator